MNGIDPTKYVDIINKKKESNNVIKRYINNLILRSLLAIVILFSLAIIYKSESSLKDNISNYFCL